MMRARMEEMVAGRGDRASFRIQGDVGVAGFAGAFSTRKPLVAEVASRESLPSAL